MRHCRHCRRPSGLPRSPLTARRWPVPRWPGSTRTRRGSRPSRRSDMVDASGKVRPVLLREAPTTARATGSPLHGLVPDRSGRAPSPRARRSSTPTRPASGRADSLSSRTPRATGGWRTTRGTAPRATTPTPTATSAACGSAPVTFSGATPVVGAGEAPEGYHLFAQDGGVFAFGATRFAGSMGGVRRSPPRWWPAPATRHRRVLGGGRRRRRVRVRRALRGVDGRAATGRRAVVGMATTADGGGYWLVASDGGIFAFGDAGFWGSMGGRQLAAPVVGMAPTADGGGYWLVASDGGIFAFGDAVFSGSMGGRPLAAPVVGTGGHAPGRRLLAGGLRRRHLRFRQRRSTSGRWVERRITRPVVSGWWPDREQGLLAGGLRRR